MSLTTNALSEDKAESTSNELKLSPLFSDSDADLTFVSADGVTFKIYSKYLEATSAGLAPPASTVIDPLERIPLTEPASVLEVFFQSIHPRSESEQYHQPSVMDMKPRLFFDVAEAAEKYIVYGAMNTCVTYMHQIYSTYPVEVLNHCANHGYIALADKAAPLTISLSNPIEKTMRGLKNASIAVKWTKYYGHWLEIPRRAAALWRENDASGIKDKCQRRAALLDIFLRNATADLTCGVEDVQTSVPCSSLFDCDCGSSGPRNWRKEISQKIRSIPKFSEIA